MVSNHNCLIKKIVFLLYSISNLIQRTDCCVLLVYCEIKCDPDPSGLFFAHVHGCCIWFLRLFWNSAMKTAELRGSLKSWNMVETAGFVSLCFGHTWFIVLSPVLGDSALNRFFPGLYCCTACWLWHEYPLSLLNLSVIDSPCVVFAAGPPPSAAHNVAWKHNVKRPRLETCGSS